VVLGGVTKVSVDFSKGRATIATLAILTAVTVGIVAWIFWSSEPSNYLFLLTVLVLGAITAIAVATNLYLYRWRKILLGKQEILLPEDLGIALHEVARRLGSVHSVLAEVDKKQKATNETITTDVHDLLATTLTLHQSMDEKDQELRRLKGGYDAELFRRFVYRFVRVREAVSELQASAELDQKTAHYLGRLLDDAIEQCGIEQFSPAIGSDYRNAVGVADNPRVDRTANLDDAFKIVEVIHPGYRLRMDRNAEPLVPARVAILLTVERT
jgi:hypothetical protein